MSGRWEEKIMPFTCIIDLLDAIEGLNGYNLVKVPEDVRNLRSSEAKLAELSRRIEETLSTLDTEAIGIATGVLDSSDSNLSEYKSEMDKLTLQTSSDLQKIQDLYDEYVKEEAKFQQSLNRLSNIKSLELTTPGDNFVYREVGYENKKVDAPNGLRELEFKHGRYHYRHWVSSLGTENLEWYNKLHESYSDIGERRRRELKKSRANTSSQINRVKISLRNRVASAKEAALKASNEELRRKRDKEIMNVSKKAGFKVTRKQVGKKVQYALVRQR